MHARYRWAGLGTVERESGTGVGQMRIRWRYLDLSYQRNLGMVDLKIGMPWSDQWLIRILINSPVTVTSQLSPLFVKRSMFASRYIVHPGGGGAARLVCEECGTEYPYVASPAPCAFCAVMKESGITICIAHRTREWRWSEWGWAVRYADGYYLLDPDDVTEAGYARVRRFKYKQDAEWVLSKNRLSGDIEPYPLNPVQNPRPDRAIMDSIMSRSPGIGAKPGLWGNRQLP